MAAENSSRARLPNGCQGPLGPGGRYGYRKKAKAQDAQERANYRANLSDKEQIARLDKRLGPGQGAQKERARLNARIKE